MVADRLLLVYNGNVDNELLDRRDPGSYLEKPRPGRPSSSVPIRSGSPSAANWQSSFSSDMSSGTLILAAGTIAVVIARALLYYTT